MFSPEKGCWQTPSARGSFVNVAAEEDLDNDGTFTGFAFSGIEGDSEIRSSRPDLVGRRSSWQSEP